MSDFYQTGVISTLHRYSNSVEKLEKIGELIEYKTGPQIRDAAVKVQAEQLEIGKILDKVKK